MLWPVGQVSAWQKSAAREDAVLLNALYLLTDQESSWTENHHGILSAFPGA